jgi:hypothetical protein
MRYFVLTGAGLAYYTTEEEYKSGASARGQIASTKILNLVVDLSEENSSLRIRHKEHGKDLRLVMDSPHELSVWEGALRKLLDHDPKRVVAEQDDFRNRVQEQLRVAKLGGKVGSSELQNILPWRRPRAPLAVKNALKVSNREPYAGPPVPAGYTFAQKDIATRMDLTTSADMKFAFKMLDTSNANKLPREAARNWFRCMGWCSSSKDLDAVLDDVFLGLTERKRKKKMPVQGGSWSLEQLKEAQGILNTRVGENGSVGGLKQALQLLAGSSEHVDYERIKVCNFAERQPPVSEDDFSTVMEQVHLDPGSDSVSFSTLSMRIVSRIVSPGSVLDLPKDKKADEANEAAGEGESDDEGPLKESAPMFSQTALEESEQIAAATRIQAAIRGKETRMKLKAKGQITAQEKARDAAKAKMMATHPRRR